MTVVWEFDTQALGGMTGLQSLGLSQCSGVTGEGLLQLLPSWPALTRLNHNCLHLTADHIDTLIKVWFLATAPGPLPHGAALPWLGRAWHVSAEVADIDALVICWVMTHGARLYNHERCVTQHFLAARSHVVTKFWVHGKR